MHAVAAGDVLGLTRLGGALCPLDPGDDSARGLLESEDLGLAFDLDACVAKPIDQQSFVFILRKDQHVRIRTDAFAHVAELGVGHLPAGRPEIDRGHSPAASDHRVCETDLAVEFERPRVDGQRA